MVKHGLVYCALKTAYYAFEQGSKIEVNLNFANELTVLLEYFELPEHSIRK